MIPIYLAIDTWDYFAAKDILNVVGDEVELKLGLEFFTFNGLQKCKTIRDKGLLNRQRSLFLDLKFHDIPNTVAGAVRSAMDINPDFLTLHTCDGRDPLLAAVDAADNESTKINSFGEQIKRPKLLGVTVLTSINSITYTDVFERALVAHNSGLDGIICPAPFLSQIRYAFPDMFLMVPGIRLPNSNTHDQKAVGTPQQACEDGADALVIGRAITESADPMKTILKIKASMA